MLGRRTAEMHLALASETDDPAFVPQPLGPKELAGLVQEMEARAVRTFEGLKALLAQLPDSAVESAGLVLSRRKHWLDCFRSLGGFPIRALQTRVHGDYHLC